MKSAGMFLLIILLACSSISFGQAPLSDTDILRLYKGLRVADISDAMDLVGLHDACLMSQEIEPLWRDIEHFSHQLTGIALTVRYVPTNRKFPTDLSKEEFEKWRDQWYTHISPEPFIDSITPGKVIVIDDAGNDDTGTAGSNNTMLWKKKGAVGLISTGGVRDTDEVIREGIPVYMDLSKRGRGIRPGRNELESVNKPVVVGGVLVRPGDVIVADGDGVIVVPRDKAIQVAKVALEVLNIDKQQRKALYRELGIPVDFTVE
jgi:4-hydroxy-4-methyl-2-oxoglutarate aldolase